MPPLYSIVKGSFDSQRRLAIGQTKISLRIALSSSIDSLLHYKMSNLSKMRAFADGKVIPLPDMPIPGSSMLAANKKYDVKHIDKLGYHFLIE